jgi:predicted O-linked N-acetylglucosamine transferase (SPINDLY family)
MLSPAQQNELQSAVVHHLADRFDAAAAIYERLRAHAPEDFQVNHLLGALRHQQGRAREALPLLEKARRSLPRSAPTLMCLGLVLSALGRHREAEKALGASLTLAPKNPEGWSNLGAIYAVSARTAEAIAAFQRAIALQADYAQAWTGLGSVLHASGRSAEAVECQNRALALEPQSTKARFARAQALVSLHRPDEALADFDAHLALRPGHHQARSFRLYLLNYRDDLSREALFAEHLDYGRAIEAEERVAPLRRPLANDPLPGRRLRVAFLSPDLRGHSVAYFIEPLLAQLDRTQFEVILYHDHYSVDATSERLRKGAAIWRHFSGWADGAVEEAIRADAPDVLVDLAGHTGFNRLELYARRLAPVQLAYLGYPATTGLRAMDYRLTDGVADPVGETDHLHTESLRRFAPTAWAYAPPAEAPEPALSPGLQGEAVAVGSFNALSKLSASTLALWRELLAAAPDARLVLKSSGLDPERYGRHLAAAGLPLERVQLLTMAPDVPSHLACYAKVDVALDPFPYNGTTTTCEALWMGVPVVTLAGDRHVARVGASLLTAVGHAEWIAHSREDYIRIALGLARDIGRRRELRTGLRESLRRSPLLDHAGQAERFGAALRACWEDWCGKQDAPAHAEVSFRS